jgi:hypothetical protein
LATWDGVELDADGSIAGLDLSSQNGWKCGIKDLVPVAKFSTLQKLRINHCTWLSPPTSLAIVAGLPLTEIGLVRIASDFWLPSIAEHFAGTIQVLDLEAQKPLFASDPENLAFSRISQ